MAIGPMRGYVIKKKKKRIALAQTILTPAIPNLPILSLTVKPSALFVPSIYNLQPPIPLRKPSPHFIFSCCGVVVLRNHQT